MQATATDFNGILKGIFLYFIIGVGCMPFSFGRADTVSMPVTEVEPIAALTETPQIELNSRSFTAQQRSSFSFNGTSEQIERGLTIVHLNSPTTFEFRTYDTHASLEAAQELVDILTRMRSGNAVFAILAHDSAAKSLSGQTAALSKMGFSQLAGLKSRQAYIMHNFGGDIHETIDDLSLTETVSLPQSVKDATIYFPKETYSFEPNNNRYIAHAGGEVNGIKSTNSKEALDQNYKRGFRLFELDIISTSDGHMVAAHDWKMWARFTDYNGALPPSLAEFKKHKIYGDYTTMEMKDINAWFKAHPDAQLVTDKVNDPIAFANAFTDKNRLMMELFSLLSIEEATQNGIRPIISQEPLMAIVGDKLNYLKVNDIQHVAVSRRIISSQKKLLLQLRDAGIKVYVYNVGFDPGKDEKYVYDNELGLVYGMYADKWVFDQMAVKAAK